MLSEVLYIVYCELIPSRGAADWNIPNKYRKLSDMHDVYMGASVLYLSIPLSLRTCACLPDPVYQQESGSVLCSVLWRVRAGLGQVITTDSGSVMLGCAVPEETRPLQAASYHTGCGSLRYIKSWKILITLSVISGTLSPRRNHVLQSKCVHLTRKRCFTLWTC